VRLLEGLLGDPNSPLAMTDAVGARAVRAQSDSERAIFYLESAELLEHAGAVNEAQRAYRAALRAMPGLAPAEHRPDAPRQRHHAPRQAAPKQKAVSVHTLMAEARDAAVQAPATPARPATPSRRCQLLGQILGRDPHYRDAIGLTRALATQLPEPAPAINLLSTVFGRITDPGLRYELGVFLGEQAEPRRATPSPTSTSPPWPAPTASRRCAAWSAATSSSDARPSRRPRDGVSCSPSTTPASRPPSTCA
jgi:hypothetical protein